MILFKVPELQGIDEQDRAVVNRENFIKVCRHIKVNPKLANMRKHGKKSGGGARPREGHYL